MDKVAHFCIHGTLAVFGFLALNENFGNRFNKKKMLFLVLGFCFGYGLLIEALQFALPINRSAEIGDVLANMCGALLGCWLIQRFGSLIPPTK